MESLWLMLPFGAFVVLSLLMRPFFIRGGSRPELPEEVCSDHQSEPHPPTDCENADRRLLWYFMAVCMVLLGILAENAAPSAMPVSILLAMVMVGAARERGLQ